MKKLLGMGFMAVIAAVALSACGGGSSGDNSTAAEGAQTPPATNTVDGWVSDFKSATASGDCAEFQALGFTDPCQQTTQTYANRTVGDSATFGSGAVVDLDGDESLILFINDGKWSLSGGYRFGHPTVGTTAEDPAPFKAALDGTLDGIRTKNCKELFKYALTPQGQSPQSFCSEVFITGGVASALGANPDTEFTSLGGTADVQFYAAPLPYKGKTLVVTYPVVDDLKAPQDLTMAPALTPPSDSGA